MDDIYEDLENYNDVNVVEELRNENIELKQKIENYASAMQKLQRDFDELATEFKKLEMNYSSLLKTARAEIERKTQSITNLNLEKDAMVLNAIQNQSYGAYRRIVSSRFDPQANDSRMCKKDTSDYKTMKHDKSKLVEEKNLGVSSSKQDQVLRENKHKKISDYTIPKLAENSKPCSVRSRRKSMSALRSENNFYLSDDEYNPTSNEQRYEKRTTGTYGEHREHTRQRSSKGSGSSVEDKYSGYKESAFETLYRSRDYEKRKRRHRYEMDRQPNYSPERYRKITRHGYQPEYRHNDIENSRYTHQSRSHDDRTYERDYYEGYKHNNFIEDDYNENRSKKMKYNHTPTYPDERVFQQETHHTDEELFQKVIGDMQYTSCQSPDMIIDHPTHLIPEIKLTAEEELEDPRLNSRKYTLKTKEDKVILSTVNSKVDLKKCNWNIQHVMLPDALLYPPKSQNVSESMEIHNTLKNKENSNALLAQDQSNIQSNAGESIDNLNMKYKPIPPPSQIESHLTPFDKCKSATNTKEYSDALLAQDYINTSKSIVKDNLNVKQKPIPPPNQIERNTMPSDKCKSTTKTTEYSDALLTQDNLNTPKSNVACIKDNLNVKQRPIPPPTQIESSHINPEQCKSKTKTTENRDTLLVHDNTNVSKSNASKNEDSLNIKQKQISRPTQIETGPIPPEQCKSKIKTTENRDALLAQDNTNVSKSNASKNEDSLNVKQKQMSRPTQIETGPIPPEQCKSKIKTTENRDALLAQDNTNVSKSNASNNEDSLNVKQKQTSRPTQIETAPIPPEQCKSKIKTTENKDALLAQDNTNVSKSNASNNEDSLNVKQNQISRPTQIETVPIPPDHCISKTKTTENRNALLAQDNTIVAKSSNNKDNLNVKEKMLPLPTKVESKPIEETKSKKLAVQDKISNVTPKNSKIVKNKQSDNIESIQTVNNVRTNPKYEKSHVESESIYENLDAPALNMSIEEGEITDLLLIGLDSGKFSNNIKVHRESNVVESKYKEVKGGKSLERIEENIKNVELQSSVAENITKKSTSVTSSQEIIKSDTRNIETKSHSSDKIKKKSNREIVAGDLELSDETNDNQDFQKHFLKQPNKKEDSIEQKESIPEIDIKVIRICSPDEEIKSKGKRKTKKTKLSTKKPSKTTELKSEIKTKEKKIDTKISTPMKNKFSDLFGDSSSLITPEDLGVGAIQVINNYEPIIEDAQDALDLKQNNEPVTIQVQEEKLETKDEKALIQNDEIKPVASEVCKEDLPMQKPNVIVHSVPLTQDSDVVKTVIISTGTQPQLTNVHNANNGIQNKAVDHLIALATSTPQKSITVPSIKLPDESCNSNDSRSSSNTLSVTSLTQSDDVPDVRLFIKRKKRRVIKKA